MKKESGLEPSRVPRKCGRPFGFLKPCNLQRIELFVILMTKRQEGTRWALGDSTVTVRKGEPIMLTATTVMCTLCAWPLFFHFLAGLGIKIKVFLMLGKHSSTLNYILNPNGSLLTFPQTFEAGSYILVHM